MDRRVEFKPNPVKVKPEERIGWILSGSMAPRTNQSPRTEERQANQASATLEEVNLSHSELMTTLKKHTPAGDTLVTKMKEPPLFMFSTIPGKNSPVQVFYDGGNSHLLFKRGTPKNLWGCLMRSGPHQLGAVGATTLMGGDCWACQPMLTNGRREVWVGIEVDQITTDFPMVDLREATNEIKASKPDDPELQRLVVPEVVGGLLGIQYIAHYPRKVHSLDCGLGIYELRLTSDGPATATIAGPHHSFDLLMEKVGNVSALLGHFTEGLLKWGTHAPPMPEHFPLSAEELAYSANAAGVGVDLLNTPHTTTRGASQRNPKCP